jgi:hypothetical protein
VELNHFTKWISSQAVTPSSSPTFVGLTLTGLTAGRIPVVTTGGLIADSPYFLWDNDYGELHLKSTTAIYFGEDSESLIYHNGYYMRIIDDDSIHLDAPAIVTAGTLGAGAITGTSFIIGANTISSFTNLASLAGLTYASASFVKMTAAGTFGLDTTTYLSTETDPIFVASYAHGITGVDGTTIENTAGVLNVKSGIFQAAGSYYQAGDSPSFVTASLSSQLKILEGGATPTKYTIFQGGDQTVDLTYTLPTALGAAGTVLTDVAGDGVLSWAAGGGGTSDHAALSHLAYADSGHTGFQATHANLTSLVSLSYTASSLVRMTAANTFTLDDNLYLTSVTPDKFTSPIWAHIDYMNSNIFTDSVSGTGNVSKLFHRIRANTGTTVNSNSAWYVTNRLYIIPSDIYRRWSFKTTIQSVAYNTVTGLLDDATAYVGILSTFLNPLTTDNHIGFYINGGSLYASNGNGAAGTQTDTGIDVEGGLYYTLRVKIEETQILFYVDNVLVATHTTNLPSDVSYYYGLSIKNTGVAANRSCDMLTSDIWI